MQTRSVQGAVLKSEVRKQEGRDTGMVDWVVDVAMTAGTVGK